MKRPYRSVVYTLKYRGAPRGVSRLILMGETDGVTSVFIDQSKASRRARVGKFSGGFCENKFFDYICGADRTADHASRVRLLIGTNLREGVS